MRLSPVEDAEFTDRLNASADCSKSRFDGLSFAFKAAPKSEHPLQHLTGNAPAFGKLGNQDWPPSFVMLPLLPLPLLLLLPLLPLQRLLPLLLLLLLRLRLPHLLLRLLPPPPLLMLRQRLQLLLPMLPCFLRRMLRRWLRLATPLPPH